MFHWRAFAFALISTLLSRPTRISTYRPSSDSFKPPSGLSFIAIWPLSLIVIDVSVTSSPGVLKRLQRLRHHTVVSGDMRLHMRLIGLVWGLQMVHGFGRSLAARDEHGRVHAGAIVGVGSVQSVSAVRWGVAGGIVLAWILTSPCSAFIAAIAWWFGQSLL